MMDNFSTKLSFAGQSNKWNTAEDAAKVVELIEKHPNLRILDLENNTLGPESAKVIGDALAKHPEFQRAHFKDLFTGRLKTEIPLALKHLFSGINRAGAHLLELDLSDNALGPVGVEGMVDFMCSPACYSLEELRLNNNGLGITGGTMLAKSLIKLQDNSQKAGTPWQLKVFIAGRNRLEKVGAKVYAPIFARLGSLEELAMPQNGIFHEGIAALADALSHNPGLKILNLNDNTFTVKGAVAMAKQLHTMQALEVINFGDCLLKTRGTIEIARALMEGHLKLKELHLDGNEMTTQGGLSVAEAVQNKHDLTVLNLDCNQFGDEGRASVEQLLEGSGTIDALLPMESNEDPDSDAEEDNNDDDDNNDDVSTEDSSDEEDVSSDDDCDSDIEVVGGCGPVLLTVPSVSAATVDDSFIIGPVVPTTCSAAEFVSSPSAAGLVGLVSVDELSAAATATCTRPDQRVTALVALLCRVAAMANTDDKQLLSSAKGASVVVGDALFRLAADCQLVSFATNSLLASLGLIKCEDKQFTAAAGPRGVLRGLATLAQGTVIPRDAKNTLHYFVTRPNARLDQYPQEKSFLVTALSS